MSTPATSADDQLPEPTSKQVGLGLEAIRRALDGERLQIYGVTDDGERRLRVRPVKMGEIEEA